jgi:hypothetical protein
MHGETQQVRQSLRPTPAAVARLPLPCDRRAAEGAEGAAQFAQHVRAAHLLPRERQCSSSRARKRQWPGNGALDARDVTRLPGQLNSRSFSAAVVITGALFLTRLAPGRRGAKLRAGVFSSTITTAHRTGRLNSYCCSFRDSPSRPLVALQSLHLLAFRGANRGERTSDAISGAARHECCKAMPRRREQP